MLINQDTLQEVLARIAAAHVHRAFVVDAEGHPLRVISLGDIIGVLVSEPPGYFGNFFDGEESAVPGL